jgi:hypothetical protein
MMIEVRGPIPELDADILTEAQVVTALKIHILYAFPDSFAPGGGWVGLWNRKSRLVRKTSVPLRFWFLLFFEEPRRKRRGVEKVALIRVRVNRYKEIESRILDISR